MPIVSIMPNCKRPVHCTGRTKKGTRCMRCVGPAGVGGQQGLCTACWQHKARTCPNGGGGGGGRAGPVPPPRPAPGALFGFEQGQNWLYRNNPI
jgi:hypothetical protein